MSVESQHRRVLIVDDDADVRNLLSTVLRQRSMIVDEANDGSRAISLLSANAYSVVILDLLMPGANGFDVLQAIEAQDGWAPVVLVVTGAEHSLVGELDAKKIHGIVRKPFDPLEVAAVVVACVEIRGRSTFETMALATMIGGVPLITLLGS